MKKLRFYGLRLLIVVLSVAVTLLVIEGGLRLNGERPQLPIEYPDYVARPYGPDLSPASFPNWMNSHGAFDVEHSLEKPPGIYRIGLLGDSFLGLSIYPHEKQVPQVLQATLNDPSIEVLNFSVSSAGTATAYIRYLEQASHFDLDLVLLFFTAGNDPRNNSIVLNPLVEANPFPIPGFRLNENGELVRQDIPAAVGADWYYRHPVADFLVRHSVLYGIVTRYWQRLNGAQVNVPEQETWEITASFLQYPYTQEVENAWEVTRALILKLRDEVEADGAVFAIVIVPTVWDIHPDWNYLLYQNLGQDIHIQYDLPYNEFYRKVGDAGIPILDLRPVLLEALADDPTPLYDASAHWSERGHQVVATAIAKFLRDQKLIPSK